MARPPNPLQPLGELESAVVEALWDEGELATAVDRLLGDSEHIGES